MPLPMRHLLAGSAVAGLLFLLPAGHANAQDNRNTGGAAGGVLTFIAGGAVGGIAVWQLSKLASKGKRDDGSKNAILTRFDQVDSGVKGLNEKLTKLEETSKEGIHGLSRTLESKTNLGSKIDTVSTSLGTVKSNFTELSDSFKELDRRLKEYINNNVKDQQALNSLLSETQEALEKCENEKRSLKMLETKKEYRSDQEQNMDRQWKDIMKNLCNSFYEGNNQKINPIDCLKLIKHKKSVDCYDCLDAVKELLPDSLEILPEALRSAEKYKDFNSDKIDQLFELLWKLGTDFRDEIMKDSGEGSARTSKAAESVFGREYATVVKKKKKFDIKYQGETIDMSQHLKIDGKSTYEPPGTKKTMGVSDNSCLRIHFAWHDKSKKVLIGHCGKHRR